MKVSVVIPSRNRPTRLLAAVHSVLAQTLKQLEVIVVLDGVQPEARALLAQTEDPRLVVLELSEPQGAGAARNAGVARARAPWIAFLDDDDAWSPDKLSLQLGKAEQSSRRHPVVCCRFRVRRSGAELVWPLRRPGPSEPLSEYLFTPRRLWAGEGLLITSVLFTSTELLRKLPFNPELKRHQDVDWLVRAARFGSDIEFAGWPEPLCIWNADEDRPRISNDTNWLPSLRWIQASRRWTTSRARTSFILTWVSAVAQRARDRWAFFRLLKEACRESCPRPLDLAAHLAIWCVPAELRLRVARLFQTHKKKRHPDHPPEQDHDKRQSFEP